MADACFRELLLLQEILLCFIYYARACAVLLAYADGPADFLDDEASV